ncbi:MAG: acyltransferase, partial [Williamsia herbipolensis]|nr:acyltransferase [Williamsia herbipolensis]
LPALEPVARAHGWAVDTLIRGACPFSTGSEVIPGSPGCTDWNRAAIEEVAASRPAAVVAGASRDVRAGLMEQTPPGFVEAWRALDAVGVPVLAVRDNPRFDHSPSACVEARGRHTTFCETNRATFYAADPPITHAALPDNVRYLDTADLICGARSCSPEVGNVTVYLDDNHLTASYAASMAPMVGPHLEALVAR